MGLRIESHNSHVCDQTIRAATSQAQFLPAASTHESGARQVGHCFRELPLLMAHDHNDALGKRCDIISARAAVDVFNSSRVILHESCIDVAVTIDLQGTQEPDVHNTAMNVHTHYI